MRDQAERLRQLVSGSTPIDSTPAPDFQATHGRPKIIAVTSGKGGVGKTMITVNLALLLAENASRVLIVDADLGLANVDVMLGMESDRHIGHVLMSACSPEDVAATGPSGIKVISGGSGLRELADAGRAERLELLERLRAYYEMFDYVLVDTSPGIGSEVGDFLSDASEVLLVTTPEPTSIRDTYAALKSIVQEMPDKRVTTVVNGAGPKQAAQAMEALNHVSRKFLERECDRWYGIEFDAMVGRAIRERRPLVLAYPRSPAAVGLRHISKLLAVQPGQNHDRAGREVCSVSG